MRRDSGISDFREPDRGCTCIVDDRLVVPRSGQRAPPLPPQVLTFQCYSSKFASNLDINQQGIVCPSKKRVKMNSCCIEKTCVHRPYTWFPHHVPAVLNTHASHILFENQNPKMRNHMLSKQSRHESIGNPT